MSGPPEYGNAISIEDFRAGTKNIGTPGSVALESRAFASLPGAFAPSSAQRLNADMKKKANAAVAIILALNLIVASRTADPDRQKTQRPMNLTRMKHAKNRTTCAMWRPPRKTVSTSHYGTLMTVFTKVVDAVKAITLPLIVVTAATPGLETVIPG